jgi:hypothetical protein
MQPRRHRDVHCIRFVRIFAHYSQSPVIDINERNMHQYEYQTRQRETATELVQAGLRRATVMMLSEMPTPKPTYGKNPSQGFPSNMLPKSRMSMTAGTGKKNQKSRFPKCRRFPQKSHDSAKAADNAKAKVTDLERVKHSAACDASHGMFPSSVIPSNNAAQAWRARDAEHETEVPSRRCLEPPGWAAYSSHSSEIIEAHECKNNLHGRGQCPMGPVPQQQQVL